MSLPTQDTAALEAAHALSPRLGEPQLKIGVLFCAYGLPWKDTSRALAPWKDLKVRSPAVFISAVSMPFKEMFSSKGFELDKETPAKLMNESYANNITAATVLLNPTVDNAFNEWQARNKALRVLLDRNCSHIILVDADEFYTKEQIRNCFDFVSQNPNTCWFNVCLKNFVFDSSTYLEEPFTPPRIFRVNYGKYRLHEFCHDNYPLYRDTETKNDIFFAHLAGRTIPSYLAFVKHMTWLNNKRSRTKVEYQLKHLNECSYRWDEQKGLMFNEEYYAKRGLALPRTLKLPKI